MDIFLPIVLLIIFCILFSICGWCCKRHKAGIVYGRAPPVTVTTTTTTIPPYPTGPPHPVPQPHYQSTGLGFSNQTPYPPAPPGVHHHYALYQPMYPAVPYGFPQSGFNVGTMGPSPYIPSNTPYPPVQPMREQLPPPYHEAVGQPAPSVPAQPYTNEVYSKQSPYNPNY